MPRTSRRTATTGLLWEALAPLVRWPLHSPRRLASLLAALVVIGWLVATAGPSGAADPAPTDAAERCDGFDDAPPALAGCRRCRRPAGHDGPSVGVPGRRVRWRCGS